MIFIEYKNFPKEGWGRIKKHNHEQHADKQKDISCVQFHDKKYITLISIYDHGCKILKLVRIRSGRKKEVFILRVFNNYRNKKVGVSVGDQYLRNKRSFTNEIRKYGQSRKQSMHIIQKV